MNSHYNRTVKAITTAADCCSWLLQRIQSIFCQVCQVTRRVIIKEQVQHASIAMSSPDSVDMLEGIPSCSALARQKLLSGTLLSVDVATLQMACRIKLDKDYEGAFVQAWT